MGTRCSITVKDGVRSYRIYRHSDGYPEGVLADIKLLLSNDGRCAECGFSDPEYFLANFIFYAKLSFFEYYKGTSGFPFKGWELTYGVCEPYCDHGDLDYKYIIDAFTREIEIQEYDYGKRAFKIIFKGKIEEAFDRYLKNSPYKDGCHIDLVLLKLIEKEVKAINALREYEAKMEKAKSTKELNKLLHKLRKFVILNRLNCEYYHEIMRKISDKYAKLFKEERG